MTVGVTICVSFVAVLVVHEAEHDVVFVEDHPNDEEPPETIDVGTAVSTTTGTGAVNVAVTGLFEVMANVQAVVALTQAPENPANVELPLGVAVRVIEVPLV